LGSSKLSVAVEAVFPIGRLAIPITWNGKPDPKPSNIPRYRIQNANNSPVPTDNFLDPKYGNVSAILGCWKKDMLAGDIQLTLVHNPLATNPLPRSILGATKEYVSERNGDRYVLRLLSETV